jgi:hypothetical protein
MEESEQQQFAQLEHREHFAHKHLEHHEVPEEAPPPRRKRTRRSTFLAPRNSAIIAKLEQRTLERQSTLERQDSTLLDTLNESNGARLVRQVTFEELAIAAEARAELRESRSERVCRVQRANEQQVSTDGESKQQRVTWDGTEEEQAMAAARSQRSSSGSSSVQTSAAAVDDANEEDVMEYADEEKVQEIEAADRHR